MKSSSVYCIEGEYVTSREIAARTGLAPHSVWNKMRREAGSSDPITWVRLSASAKPRRGNYKPRQCRGWYTTTSRAEGEDG